MWIKSSRTPAGPLSSYVVFYLWEVEPHTSLWAWLNDCAQIRYDLLTCFISDIHLTILADKSPFLCCVLCIMRVWRCLLCECAAGDGCNCRQSEGATGDLGPNKGFTAHLVFKSSSGLWWELTTNMNTNTFHIGANVLQLTINRAATNSRLID